MVGIVIPAYNRSNCLRQALKSLTLQTLNRFFVIVVDDASQEDLKSVVDEFNNDLHITYVRQEANQGPGAARQKGLEMLSKSNIDYVMFLDSDDLLCPHAVARLSYEIQVNKYDLISSGIWQQKNKVGGTISQNATWTHGKIYRVAYLMENKIAFPNIRTNEDLAFNLQAVYFTEKKAHINEVLYLFQEEKNSITRDKKTKGDVVDLHYLEAIIIAARETIRANKMHRQMAIDLLNTYNAYQLCLAREKIVPEKTNKELAKLFYSPEFQAYFTDYKFLSKCQKLLNNYLIVDKEVFWYPQTFQEWYKGLRKWL